MVGHPGTAWSIAAVSVVCYLIFQVIPSPPTFHDMAVYRAEGMAMRQGLGLYGALPGVHGLATYPPFAAILFVPTTVLPLSMLGPMSLAFNLALLIPVAHLSLRLTGASGHRLNAGTAMVIAAALWCEPIQATLGFGQINLLLLTLILADFTVLRDTRWAGVGIGLATGLKITPAIFGIYLMITGRRRAGLTTIATTTATLVVSAIVATRDTWDFWTRYLFDDRRVGRPENVSNQTIRGWLVRAFQTRELQGWQLVLLATIVLVLLVLGMSIALRAQRRGDELGGLLATACTALLISPISWSHHWVWCAPILVYAWHRSRLLLAVTLALTWTGVVWVVPHGDRLELALTPLQVAVSGPYVVWGVATLAMTGRHPGRARRVDRSSTVANQK
ncbi:Alpha-1,2-mannosyltransferase [Aeromicrobium sp. 9AM]|nr:Alpha-1,2-mannosyltransferase [Aeromicrobium sp. 9AM]